MTNNKHAASLLSNSDRLKAALLWASGSADRLASPVMVDVDPVDGLCNLDCAWCCQAASRTSHETAKYMSEATMRWLGPFSASWGVKSWRISGDSEPTLNKGLGWLLQSGHDAGIQMGLITNGTRLEHVMSQLGQLKWLGVSLDAATRETWSALKGVKPDGFDRVIDSVREVRETWPDLDVSLKCVRWSRDKSLHKNQFAQDLAIVGQVDKMADSNYDDAAMLPDLARELGVRCIVRDAYETTQYPFTTCRATPLGGVFGADHKFHLCCDARSKFVLTDDYRRDLVERWGSNEHREMCQSIVPSGCAGCAKRDTNEIMSEMITNTQLDFI